MISELSKVPLGWEKVKFGDIAQNITARIDNPKESGLENYIGLEHLDTDEIRIKRYGSPDEVEATKFLCKKGDIIFGKRRAYLRKLAVTERDAVVSAHSMVLRPKQEKVLSKFLPWLMQSSQFWKTAFAISEGSLSPTIKWKTLSAQEFWLPSLNEQRKIAEILWSIESNVEKLEQLFQVAEKLKKGLLEELLTRGIGHRKFKKTDLGEIPEEWDNCELADLAVRKDDIVAGPFGSNLKVSDYVDKGVPIIRLQNVEQSEFVFKDIKYVSKEKANELKYHSFRKGDIVLAKLGDPIGKTCFVPESLENGIVTSDVVRIRLNPEKIDFIYILHLLNSFIVSSQLAKGTIGTTRPRVNLNDVRELVIPLPGIDEQRRISSILLAIDSEILACKNNIHTLRLVGRKLANSFLSGELLVPTEGLN